MNALQMFNELGFKLYNSGEDFLLYKYGTDYDEIFVRFDLPQKEYVVYSYTFTEYHDSDFVPMNERPQNIKHCSKYGRWVGETQFVISIRLHKAITEQMRELGWIE